MNRQYKVLLLILAMLCVLSLCIVSAGANEIDVQDQGKQPAQLLILTYSNCKTEYTEGEYFDVTGFRGYVSCYDPQYSFYIASTALTYLETGPLTTNVKEITFVYENVKCKIPITVIAAEAPVVPETTVTPEIPETPVEPPVEPPIVPETTVTPEIPETPVEPPVEPPVDPSLQVLGIDATASKTEFLALEKVDPSIFTIEIIKADGTRTIVDASACSFSPSLDDPISAYVKAFTVTYSEGGATFSDIVEISVSPILLVQFEGLESAYLYEGMIPSIPQGLKATVYYNGAQTISQEVTEYDVEYPSDTITPDANGKTIITLVFDSKRVQVEVAVSPIVSYKATGFKNTYYYGDPFNCSNAKIVAVYGDGTTRDVTAEVQFDAPEIVTAGCKITAIHNGYDLTELLGFTLPSGELTIVTPPAKLHYEVGESFDPSGLTIAIEYSDGVRKMLAPSDYTITVPATLASSDKAATVEYFGASTKIAITVGNEAYITSIQLIGAPDVRTYYEGYMINTAGIIIEAYYSDGTKSTLDLGSLTFTPSLTTPLTVDMTSVTISIGEGDKYHEITYPITVQDKFPTALAPISFPNKLQYNEGERFDPDGIELRLYFNDGSFIVPSTYNFSPALGTPIILRSNVTEKYIVDATYEYEGNTYFYPIEVTVTPAKVENLLITRNPVKTTYEIGEQFDPTGLDIIIIYEDRALSMVSIPEGYYTYSPTVITETTKEIVFSFRGFNVSLPITVNGVDSSEDTTGTPETPPEETTITPPETETDTITTQEPEVTTAPNETTEAPEVSSDPETTNTPETTISPEDVTTDSSETTDPGDDKKDPVPLLYIWIAVIAIIVIALIALIIYYKKNFT